MPRLFDAFGNCCDPCGPWIVLAQDEATGGVISCTHCAVAPRQWTFDPGTITNAGCLNCNYFSGPQIITHDGTITCSWFNEANSLCGDGSFRRKYQMDFSAIEVFLKARVFSGGFLDEAVYVKGSGPDCLGPMTLSLLSTGGFCAGWPALLTVSAV